MAEVRMLTEEDILNANAYVPLSDKAAYARGIANMCVSEMEVSIKDGDDTLPLPNMAREEPKMKMLYGMWVMLHFYLGFIGSEELNTEEYDEWGKVSLFNQIERFKSSKNADVRNKAFDIVDDYREFYRMIGCEINSILTARNDIIPRIINYARAMVTPEAVDKLTKDLDGLKAQIEEYKKIKAEN